MFYLVLIGACQTREREESAAAAARVGGEGIVVSFALEYII